MTSDAIPDAAREELARLEPKLIYLLGGPSAVSEAVEAKLTEYATVHRLDGESRYATSAAVGRAVWPDGASTVYLASGQDYADGLAGGAAAALDGAPVYITAPDALPTPIYGELIRLRPTEVVVLGGTAAVSGYVVNLVRAILPAAEVTRVAGEDRYATAAAVAARGWPAGADAAYLATGTGFADALSGVPAAGRADAPVLLARPTCLPADVAETLSALAPEDVLLLGGPAALAEGAPLRRC